ncbi:GMP synthase [Granulosicoccaceae sp. 1_MG-2023]|nr:GMP synthase [Granulosicoccaceae sp. 1_MG-2023]
MNIGILLADHVSDPLRSIHGDYDEMFRKLLLAVDASLHFTVYPVVDGVFPERTDDCDAWLITGSRCGTYDKLDWIARLREFIRQVVADGGRIAGICFGHQLLADTLGGESGKSPKGWGVGLHHWEPFAAVLSDELVPAGLKLLVSHQDQVRRLPADGTRIAGSAFCENAAFRIGNQVLAFQGHPEFTPAYARDLMNLRRGVIPGEVVDEAMASLDEEPDRMLVGQWLVRFLKGEARAAAAQPVDTGAP